MSKFKSSQTEYRILVFGSSTSLMMFYASLFRSNCAIVSLWSSIIIVNRESTSSLTCQFELSKNGQTNYMNVPLFMLFISVTSAFLVSPLMSSSSLPSLTERWERRTERLSFWPMPLCLNKTETSLSASFSTEGCYSLFRSWEHTNFIKRFP